MLRLEGFNKRYGKVHAVRDLDLTVAAGQAFVLLGSNGSGKTSVLRSVAGVQFPTSGRILVGGVDVVADPVTAKRQLAYLPQRVTLPGFLTGRELLRFYADLGGAPQARVEEALAFVGLEADADRFTREYSGGMTQRLGLGIAYLRPVPLLLLDEPTLNLDPTGLDRFRAWMGELRRRGSTVLFTSHILEEALRLADRVGVLSQGRLVRVEDVSCFRDRVVAATSVRVVLAGLDERVVAAARAAGASGDRYDQASYTFEAPPHARQRVIQAIESAGGLIEELHTEPPNWEDLVNGRREARA